MSDKRFDHPLSNKKLSEDQLEMVVGGRITEGDKERLSRFIKQTKYEGGTLDEAIAFLRKTFTGKAADLYLDDYIAFVTENW